MKLLAQTDSQWQYQLGQNEADILLAVVNKFPLGTGGPVQISKTDKNAKATERKKMLTEALAEHRQDLKEATATVLGADKWQPGAEGRVLTLTPAGREILLQVLNDIRVGCWRALGEPEVLDQPVTTKRQQTYRNLMDLAGYFEANLLGPEE